ncbi:hypothetical protein MM239_17275 [Belliella sp. DSM 111904]|uniref:Uncharacterized protein n=1 Tax=Belliella filtrata TaxID=2923435 RepID=A0ABS9V415_9BACT|nr:hypothetical protein [Belliella filtrata]MCH7411153.1 hypothetical protein [Belliella filtrata]
MTLDNWKSLYKILDKQLSVFSLAYPTMRNGKNQKLREEAGKKVNNSIDVSSSWIRKYPEAFKLLTGEGDRSDYGRMIIWDEFIKPNYFEGDMTDFLEKIQKKIESLEMENNDNE